jgi:hypothetical protein
MRFSSMFLHAFLWMSAQRIWRIHGALREVLGKGTAPKKSLRLRMQCALTETANRRA